MHRIYSPLLLAVVLAGCANTSTPRYDVKFGDALRQGRQMMTLNPSAGTSAGPETGMDGKSATEALGRYHDAYKAPPPVVNVINIGNGAK